MKQLIHRLFLTNKLFIYLHYVNNPIEIFFGVVFDALMEKNII